MTRRTKTPAERAQEAYDVAERIAARLASKGAKARAELDELDRELTAARIRCEYLSHHPDLPKQKTTTGDTPA